MNKSSLLVSVLAFAILAGAVLLGIGRGSGDVPPPPVDTVDVDDAVDSLSASPEEASFDLFPVEQFADDETIADDLDDERVEVQIDVDDSRQLVIQVWDRKKGVVASEADVYVLEGYQGGRGAVARDPFAPHWCEAAVLAGKHYKATTEGRVTLPPLASRAIVAARLSGASGMIVIQKRHRELESVMLLADEVVTVRVVDQAGRPVANVPVGIGQRIPKRIDSGRVKRELSGLSTRIAGFEKRFAKNPSERASAGGQLENLLRHRRRLLASVRQVKAAAASKATAKAKPTVPVVTHMEMKARRRTDEQGRAVFQYFQLYRQRTQKWWPKQHRDRFSVVLMVPMVKTVAVPFRGKPVSEEVIEIQMPATGSLVLRTVDCDGRPFSHPVRGELRMVDGKQPSWARLPIRKEQDEREIVFPFVGVGMQARAHCRLDDGDFRWRSDVLDGPQRAGEQVVVDLVVAPDAAMLYGRLLTAEGHALAHAKTTFLINSMRGRMEGEEVVLDDEGRFHLPYRVGRDHAAPFRLQVRYQGRVPVPGLAATLSNLPTQGVLEIGELQIGDLNRVTFGRVVNDLGDAIAGARVQLQRQREVGRRKPRMQWQDEAFTSAKTDLDGSFMLFGDLDAGRYRLRVTAAEHLAVETSTLPGRDGTVIRMPRRSRVLGTVLAPEWMPNRRIKVRLQSLVDNKVRRDAQIRNFKGKNYIYFDRVRPGIYSVQLRLDGFPDAFLRVDNLEVLPGQMDVHARLKDLDLGGILHRFEVFAVDQDGKRMTPKSALLARIMRPDGEHALVGFPWRRGRTEIFSAQATLEVLPKAPGYRAEQAVLAAGRSELRFLRVPKVRLRVNGMRRVVGTDKVWISLEPVERQALARFDSRSRRMARSVRRQAASHAALGSDDVARLNPVRDGRYRVVARLGDKRRGGLVSVPLGEVDVRVVPGSPPVMLNVAVDAGAVRQAMQEVVQRQAAAGVR